MNLIPQKQKINNEDFKNAILNEEIEIIYQKNWNDDSQAMKTPVRVFSQ